MSGGMRQRVMIAMALSCNPELLIADEPTTALDVTIQAQILDLLRQLQRDLGMSILIITHDLGIVAEMADEVAVMYASKVGRASAGSMASCSPGRCTVLRWACSAPPGRSRARPEERAAHYDHPGWSPARCIFPAGCKFQPPLPV